MLESTAPPKHAACYTMKPLLAVPSRMSNDMSTLELWAKGLLNLHRFASCVDSGFSPCLYSKQIQACRQKTAYHPLQCTPRMNGPNPDFVTPARCRFPRHHSRKVVKEVWGSGQKTTLSSTSMQTQTTSENIPLTKPARKEWLYASPCSAARVRVGACPVGARSAPLEGAPLPSSRSQGRVSSPAGVRGRVPPALKRVARLSFQPLVGKCGRNQSYLAQDLLPHKHPQVD